MSDVNVEKLSGIIPEAWFDLISRVVPGTVIVLASIRPDGVSGLTVGGFAAGLVLAYAIGSVFDVVSDILFGLVFKILEILGRFFGLVFKKHGRFMRFMDHIRLKTLRFLGRWPEFLAVCRDVVVDCYSFMDFYSSRELWEKIDKLSTPRREIAGKNAAEGVMFKSLGFYLLLLAIPTRWYGGIGAPLREIRVDPILSLVFAIVAFVCRIIMQRRVTRRLVLWERTPNAGTKEGATKYFYA